MYLFLRVARKILFLFGAACLLVGTSIVVLTTLFLAIQIMGVMTYYEWLLAGLHLLIIGLVPLALNLVIGMIADAFNDCQKSESLS